MQIIGRATRDAPGKTRARFTNLIAEPDASEETVTEAVNDTLKAIAASLLMEQVLAPRFEFKPKNPASGPVEGFDYGPEGYKSDQCNVGFNEAAGKFQIEIKGLANISDEELLAQLGVDADAPRNRLPSRLRDLHIGQQFPAPHAGCARCGGGARPFRARAK